MKIRPMRLAPLVLAGLAAASQLAAQNPTAAPPPAAVKRALFWKVSSRENTAYLLGSVHLGSKDMYPLPKEVEDAFEKSTALIVEVDINHVDQAKLQGIVMESGMYAGDDTLWNHIGKENRARLEEFCDKFGFPSAAMAKMKPWVATTLVATLPMMKKGMETGLGIDKYFLDKADKTKKRVVELETAEWQLKLLSGITDEMLDKYLESTVGQDPLVEARKLQDAWMSGDPARVDKMVRESMAKGPEELNKALLTDRNPHMAEAAEQFLKGKDQAFMVVGAAHMVGKDGIVELLRQRGYKVEQVALAQ
jgi:uncharacterized protein YbaP (TraB family)